MALCDNFDPVSGVEVEEKVAAGGVVVEFRDGRPVRVVVVHRQKYDDWSFPKGGLKPGESPEAAALREVEEETGLRCRIIRELAPARYTYRNRKGEVRPKVVHYFLMEPASGFLHATGLEIDRVEWLDPAEAARRLSYEQDRSLLRTIAS